METPIHKREMTAVYHLGKYMTKSIASEILQMVDKRSDAETVALGYLGINPDVTMDGIKMDATPEIEATRITGK